MERTSDDGPDTGRSGARHRVQFDGNALDMIRITFEQGRYRVQALSEPARAWLSEYASERTSFHRAGDAVGVVDARFLADVLDSAKSAGLTIERL
jgi:hypothetical protein